MNETEFTLTEITAAMQKWKDSCNSNGLSDMMEWLNTGNRFSYARDINNLPVGSDSEAYVHAYPGIVTTNNVDELYLFVISGYLDVSTNNNLAFNTHCYKVSNGQPSSSSTGGMPIQTALQRINNWKNNHNNWITANVGATNSIFQCFIIPQNDTANGLTHNAYFALVQDSSAPGGYHPDLIIEDIDGSSIVYGDTVVFIPPMGGVGTPTEASRFHLLSLLS